MRAFSFTAQQADARAEQRLGPQLAFVDTGRPRRGVLVVYLHGSGDPRVCGSFYHQKMLAEWGFHVFSPCYETGYGIGNCDDRESCRLEALFGEDRHAFIEVAPRNSANERIVKGMRYLHAQMPEGDWLQFLEGKGVDWSKVIVSGISHGASSAALLAKHRRVRRVVTLAGPLDRDQPWLSRESKTPPARYYGFTHAADEQSAGHLASFEAMKLPGAPTMVETSGAGFAGSHRLVSSVEVEDGHLAVERGHHSPKAGEAELYEPVWRYLYGVTL